MRKTLALLLLGAAGLATAICLAPGALAAEPDNDSANATAIGEGLNGPFDIDPVGDWDWYVFLVPQFMEIRVETNGTSGDSYLYLYDANLTLLATDDDSGSSLWSRIVRRVDPGTYYAVVQDLGNSSQIMGYYVTLEGTVPVALAEGLNGPFNAAPVGTRNWFTFDVVETSNVRLELNGSTGDPVMYLFDVNLTQLAYDDDSGVGLNSRIVRQLTPGTYFARVQPLSSLSTVTNYYFTLERVSLLGPDGNGVRENATAISLGLNGPFDIDPAGDLDWYVIVFAADGVAEFATDGTAGATVIYLYDENGSWMAYDYASGNGSFSRLQAPVGARPYYILVEQVSGSLTLYNYTVEVALLAMPGPDLNDDPMNATGVSEGVSGPFDLVMGDEDWYAFQADVPGTLRVETNGRVGGAAITVYDEGMNPVAYGSATGNYSYTVASALVDLGLYFIQVQPAYNVLAALGYNLTVTFTPWNSTDGNDFRSQAERIVQGLNGPYSIQPAADADWFFFDQAEAGTASVEIVGGGGLASIQLYNETGALLAGGTYGTQQVSRSLQPARYFVRLSSAYGVYLVPSYYLNLTVPDTTAPQVAISSPADGAQFDTGSVRVAGQVEPGSRVWVNGEEVVVDASGRYATVVVLAVGSNTVTVRAQDPVGLEANASIVVVGVDPYASLTSQLNTANSQLASTQAALAAAQAVQQALQGQLDSTAGQLGDARSQLNSTNATLAAAQAEAGAQRGLAMMGMALAGLGLAAAVAVAFLMMRRRPPMASDAVPPAPAPIAAQAVTVPVTPPAAPTAPPAAQTSPPAPSPPLAP